MAPPRRASTSPAARPAEPAGPGPSARQSGYRQRSYYLHDEVAARLRDTWWGTHQLPECPTSMSDFVGLGVTLLCDLFEAEFNSGTPFPSAPAQVPRGPSITGTARQATAMRAAWAKRGPD